MTKSSTIILLFALFLFTPFINYAQASDSTKVETADKEEEEVFMIVDQMASFPGGEEALFNFLRDNIKYPEEAKLKGIEGTVYVSFVVMADGSVQKAKVVRAIGGGCDEEALRVVNLMPKWTPGEQSGKSVSVQYNLPLSFNLRRESNKRVKKRKKKLKKLQLDKPQYK